jgi:uncharacterized protein (TIGR02246 family)
MDERLRGDLTTPRYDVAMSSSVPIAFPPGREDAPVCSLYRELLLAWNNSDAAAYAALFAPDGTIVGFDGSMVEGQKEIREHLAGIFSDHEIATYVAKVREVQDLSSEVSVLRAHVGMVPPGKADIEAATNAVQTLIGIETQDGWSAALFQNTPAALHGRPEASEQLTRELTEVLHPGGGS